MSTATNYTKLNSRFGIIEYPVTLKQMEEISLEFPKTERKFYEFALKALKKVMKPDENIYSFTSANSSLTKTGFIVVAENNLIFVNLTFGMFGGATTEVLKYKEIKSVDFDLTPDPWGKALMELGVLILEIKGVFSSKKRTIRNIPEGSLDLVLRMVRQQVEKHN